MNQAEYHDLRMTNEGSGLWQSCSRCGFDQLAGGFCSHCGPGRYTLTIHRHEGRGAHCLLPQSVAEYLHDPRASENRFRTPAMEPMTMSDERRATMVLARATVEANKRQKRAAGL